MNEPRFLALARSETLPSASLIFRKRCAEPKRSCVPLYIENRSLGALYLQGLAFEVSFDTSTLEELYCPCARFSRLMKLSCTAWRSICSD